jgi:hypothetical protein|tara:strand:+ start:355 stop:525 length:171 start_codon:yes stop_codon:yes gene_type:complete
MKTLKLDPSERVWEYDDDGTKIYKLECGFGTKTLYDETEYALWKKQYGNEWEDENS